MAIGKAIRERRKELKMSVDELAKAIGKDRSTIYRYEKGDIENIPADLVIPIAKALKTSPKELMLESQDWKIELEQKEDLEERLLHRTRQFYDATDGHEFSDQEVTLFHAMAKYLMGIKNSKDYDEKISFLFMLFKQLDKS